MKARNNRSFARYHQRQAPRLATDFLHSYMELHTVGVRHEGKRASIRYRREWRHMVIHARRAYGDDHYQAPTKHVIWPTTVLTTLQNFLTGEHGPQHDALIQLLRRLLHEALDRQSLGRRRARAAWPSAPTLHPGERRVGRCFGSRASVGDVRVGTGFVVGDFLQRVGQDAPPVFHAHGELAPT